MKRIISLSSLVFFICIVANLNLFSQNKIDEKGKKQGVWSKLDKKGHKLYEGNFKDDYEDGIFIYYYEDGKTIKAKTEFSNRGTIGKTRIFNKDGGLITEGGYKNKNKDGLWLFYDAKSNKIAEERYINGVKSGEFNSWDRDKTLVERINYKNNRKNGVYYKNLYVKGYFYCTYIDDKKEGVYEEFFYFQKIRVKGQYKNNNLEGKWIYFDSIGNNILLQDWKTGSLVSEKIRIDFGRNDRYIETKDIAYFYPTGKRLMVVLFGGEEVSCINNIDEFLDLLGENNFIRLNQKLMFYANEKAIKGIGEKIGDDYIILLDPKTKTKIITDKDSRKAMELKFQKQEF